MKLIEKKCPKCGAPLSFDENAQTAVCEYCKNKIPITRKNNEVSSEDFILSTEDSYKKRYRQTVGDKILRIILLLVMMLIACFGAIILYCVINANKPNIPVKEIEYITKISQLDENILNRCLSSSLKELNQNENSPNQTGWKRVGIYLLNHKEKKRSNVFYDVYKKEYKSDNDIITVYAAVKFIDLRLSENNSRDGYYIGSTYCPKNFTIKGNICGYNTLEDFYNKVIRNQTDEYKVTSTEGMYLEKIDD